MGRGFFLPFSYRAVIPWWNSPGRVSRVRRASPGKDTKMQQKTRKRWVEENVVQRKHKTRKYHRAAHNKESEDPDSRKSSVDASFKASQAAIHLLLHGIEVHQRGKEHHVLAVHGGQRQTELLHVFRKLLA